MSARPRWFSVCTGETDLAARPIEAVSFEAVSFEAAALAYAEVAHTGAWAEVRLIVRDLETGAEQCFRLDMAVDVSDPI